MKLLNSINRDEAPLPYFVTLTYHHMWPGNYAGRKRHLDALRKRLERRYGELSAVWRLEFQKRGAPHYHLLLFVRPGQVSDGRGMTRKQQRRDALLRLRNNIAWMWHEIVDPQDMQLLNAGTGVEEVKSWRGVNAYAAKYMGKLEQLRVEVGPVGRYWGTWRRDHLPITCVTTQVSVREAFRIRRALRGVSRVRYRNRRELHGVSCFVGEGSVIRLLAWLGIIGSAGEDGSYRSWRTRTDGCARSSARTHRPPGTDSSSRRHPSHGTR